MNHEELTEHRVEMALGDVGLSKLTEENWKLAYGRYVADCRLGGYEQHLDADDFRKYIGATSGLDADVDLQVWAESVMLAFLADTTAGL